MPFWIFMLIFDLLIPFTMIGFGRYFMKTAPKKINALFGYRTSMSMKNQDTWQYAHHYSGRFWYRSGIILFPLTILGMLCFIGKTNDSITAVGLIICIIQMIPLLGVIIPTESALRRHFDEDGNKRSENQI